jgi:transcriptional regulator with GAF, ATPase, and Fis domain
VLFEELANKRRESQKEALARRFRQGPFYRLGMFPLEPPPLSSRNDDIRCVAE